jgi:hypothetical protein
MNIPAELQSKIEQHILETFNHQPAPILNGCVQFEKFSIGLSDFAGIVVFRNNILQVIIHPLQQLSYLHENEVN